MSRLYAWVTGAAAGLGAYRLLTRRRRGAGKPQPAPVPEQDRRAEELRERLAETRADAPAEPEAEAAPADVESRRREVHEQGRAAIDEMRGDDVAPSG